MLAFFFQTGPTCNQCVCQASAGVLAITVSCSELVDEGAFSGVWINTCQVGVGVHGPGQELLLWGQQGDVAEVPVVVCKRCTRCWAARSQTQGKDSNCTARSGFIMETSGKLRSKKRA